MIDTQLGWIKIHRQLADHPIFTSSDHKQLKFWLMILLSVNHKPKRIFIKNRDITINAGEMLTSFSSLSESFNRVDGKLIPLHQRVSIQTARTYVRRLIEWQMIDTKSTSDYTIISVKNWEKYQQESTSHQQTTNKPLTTNKNDKNDKNNIYTSLSCLTDELCSDIAKEFFVNEKPVRDLRDDLIGYCKQHGKRYKDYKATLQNWLRRAIKENKISKKTIEVANVYDLPILTEKDRINNVERLQQMKKSLVGVYAN